MLIKKYIFIRINIFCVIVLFFVVSVFSSIGALIEEKNAITDCSYPFKNRCDHGSSVVTIVDGLYYLRGFDQENKNDVGSLLRDGPEEHEATICGMFINFHFAEDGIYSETTEIFNIYYHFWQRAYGLGLFDLGYSISSNHTAGFNESIPIDTNEYICEVNDFRLKQALQITDTKIAVFEGKEIYNFTIKYCGDNPHILCNSDQYSFIILNLEDNKTLQTYDRDNDYLTDYSELFIYYTNPFDIDTDDDGATDYDEVMGGLFGFANSNPNDPYNTTVFRALYVQADGPYTGLTNEMIQVYGNASGGLPPYSWHWDFGDGAFSNQKNPTHLYNKANNYKITLNVTDSNGMSVVVKVTVIINSLDANFIKPEKALYINNKKIFYLPKPLIIGPIDIEVLTSSTLSGVNKVEFYINNELKLIDHTAPYCWRWEERSFFKHTIGLIVFDDFGNSKTYDLVVWKFL